MYDLYFNGVLAAFGGFAVTLACVAWAARR